MSDFNSNQLETLGEQFWFASYGNGVEMYNFYRRNGEAAVKLQPHLQGAVAGAFPRSLFYPSTTANLNLSVTQKANLSTLVFWDNGSSTVQ